MFSISTLQVRVSKAAITSSGFRNLIEDHILFLRSHRTIMLIPVDQQLVYKFTGDFYGLLNALKINPDIWWVTLRINNFKSTLDYSGDLQNIYIIPEEIIYEMLTKYLNSSNVY